MNVVICCVFPLHLPQPSWLLHPPIDTRPIDRSSNRFEPVGGQLFHPFPLPRTSCAEKQLQPTIASSSCCRWGCFVSPNAKLTDSRAAEARGGISDGVGWLLWPLSDDLEAIGHGFDSIVSSIVDDGVCVLCVEERVFCVMVIAKTTDVDTLCCDERWLSMLDLRESILTNTSYPVSDIRIVHFQGKILWNVEVRARCT